MTPYVGSDNLTLSLLRCLERRILPPLSGDRGPYLRQSHSERQKQNNQRRNVRDEKTTLSEPDYCISLPILVILQFKGVNN